jgi:hypothetical protein
VRRREAGLRVELADLGAWGERATLVSEYDPEADSIRVNRHAFEAVRASLGPAEAERFFACAVAHERFHRAQPLGSEAEAEAFAQATTDTDPRRYAALLRPRRRA